MTRGSKLLWAVVLLLFAGETAVIVFLLTRRNWRRTALDTAVQRGHAVAVRSGCFGCHGPAGADPIPNPGSKSGSVPKWTGGTWMMWNDSPEDVRGWILNGHPPGRQPDKDALIAMPAFRDHLSDGEVDDLVAYVLAVSQFGWPQDQDVAAGRDLAVQYGCFGCHGPEGRGLIADPGSFKGYIPPWDSPDFEDLVHSRDEFGQWVQNGVSERFRKNPAANAFLDRQAIRMPAYGDRLTQAQLDQLYAYVMWVRGHPREGKEK